MTALVPNEPDYAVVYEDIVSVLDAARRAAARCLPARNLAQMRSVYLAGTAGQILQTVSAKSPAPQTCQTPSGESGSTSIFKSMPRSSIDLSKLARSFLLTRRIKRCDRVGDEA